MRRRMPVLISCLILGAVPLAGCVADESTEGGFELPRLSVEDAAETAEGAGSSFAYREGRLDVATNGCFHWSSEDEADGAWVVWPEEYAQDDDAVIMAGGLRIGADDPITGMTALLALADLPGGDESDSYFASFGTFCGADADGVIVLASFEG